MRFHIGLALFCLLASPLAAQPETLLRAGSLAVDLDPAELSLLPFAHEELQAWLCSGSRTSPRAECDLVTQGLQEGYAPSVSRPRLGLFVGDVWSLDGGLRAAVQLRDLTPWLRSAPIATDCGLWDVSMELDPDAAQTPFELALEPSVADPAQGAFAGVVTLAVRYRFAKRDTETSGDTETSSELPTLHELRTHSLELAGHWAAVPEGDPGLADGASNLMLFAGFFDGVWLDVPACGGWGGLPCQACFRPPPEVLERLNAGLGR